MTTPSSRTTIEESMWNVLESLAWQPREGMGDADVEADEIARDTGFTPDVINDAVTLLVQSGLAEWTKLLGTAPYVFGFANITPRGRLELEKRRAQAADKAAKQPGKEGILAAFETPNVTTLPPSPIGSPYGFRDDDWEFVMQRKSRSDTLFVVMGYQFTSTFYDSEVLLKNIHGWFERAVRTYNELPTAIPCALSFRALAAGYGEHLFNQIARDIIGADVAVFEASDLNPNVMVELSVALTWGVRVLPIKVLGRPAPPSDISGSHLGRLL